MASIGRNGYDIYYEVTGSGPPIIMGHSFLCSGAMWKPQLQPLTQRYQVINVDLRGHGRSGMVDQPFNLYDLIDDSLAVLDHLGIEQAVWAGLSIGGMIALRATLVAGERVSALILFDTHAGAETTFNKMKYQAMTTVAGMIGTTPLIPQISRMFFCQHTRKTNPKLIDEWKAKFSSVPLVSIRRTVAALKERDSVVARLGQIFQPALVIVGSDDQPLPPACSREIADKLPDATFKIIDRAGHLSNLEQPQAVTTIMLEFLDKLPR